jgi:hypothetical protein
MQKLNNSIPSQNGQHLRMLKKKQIHYKTLKNSVLKIDLSVNRFIFLNLGAYDTHFIVYCSNILYFT